MQEAAVRAPLTEEDEIMLACIRLLSARSFGVAGPRECGGCSPRRLWADLARMSEQAESCANDRTGRELSDCSNRSRVKRLVPALAMMDFRTPESEAERQRRATWLILAPLGSVMCGVLRPQRALWWDAGRALFWNVAAGHSSGLRVTLTRCARTYCAGDRQGGVWHVPETLNVSRFDLFSPGHERVDWCSC